MTDEQRRVRNDSDALLEALRKLKETERQKRGTPISTDEFHALADEVAHQAGDVWRIADAEERDGDAAPSTGASIESVRPLEDPEG